MSCQNQTQVTPTYNTSSNCGSNNGFVIIIVLYILLAIILGSCFF